MKQFSPLLWPSLLIILSLYTPLLLAQDGDDKEETEIINLTEVASASVSSNAPSAAAKSEANYSQLLEKFLSDQQEKFILHTVRCQFISAETLRRLVESFLSPAGTAACSGEDDLLVISDTAERIEQIKKIVADADQPVPQILVEARIVEFELSDALNKEIEIGFKKMGDSEPLRKVFSNLIIPNTYDANSSVKDVEASAGGGTSGRTWLFGGNESFKVWALINYLQTKDCARLLTSPNVVIRRGADGNITTGEKVPINTSTTTGNSTSQSTRFENVGVKLIVRPVMIAGERIRLRINPEFSNISRYDYNPETKTKAPYIALRSVSTELEAESGEMIILGGLLRKEERETDTHVPYLWRIPLIGWLFTGKNTRSITTQLVIFMTPYLITPENAKLRDQAQEGKLSETLKLKMQEIEGHLYDKEQSLGTPKGPKALKKVAE
jgi:type II secretory pathway component GspD/PulD (secretin)